jgi:hypothetical protein
MVAVALDVQLSNNLYMYGDKEPQDEFAMKAASKELTGLGALWASYNVEGISGPLMTIVCSCRVDTVACIVCQPKPTMLSLLY